MAHSLKHLGSSSGAADVPVLVLGVCADDEEVVGGCDAAVAGSGGEHNDVACVNGHGLAAFTAQDEVGVTFSEAEHLVGGGVIVVEGVDAVAPLRRPSIGSEEPLHCCGAVVAWRYGAAVDEDWQGIVWHPAIGFQVELLGRRDRWSVAFGH